jgi:uncharacterized protein
MDDVPSDPPQGTEELPSMAYDHVLSFDERKELLRIARATLREFLRSGIIPPGKPHRDCLVAPAAVFVTLHLESALRGCIGTQTEDKPLYRAVQEMAVAAATRDPRFEPVTANELADIDIQISVLSDRQRCTGAGSVSVGVHGLCIEARGHRGLLLPQVAVDAGWDATTFLARVCAKAGLPDDAWQDQDAVVETFTAQVFQDQQP